MGIILVIVLTAVLLVFICTAVKVKSIKFFADKPRRVFVFGSFVLVLIALLVVTAWYFYPFENDLPENTLIKIRTDDRNEWIDEDQTVESYTEHLQRLKHRREFTSYGGYFLHNIQCDDYVILEIYNGDCLKDGFPEYIGDYVLVFSEPETSVFVLPSDNNRTKYRIVNDEELSSLILLLDTEQ